MKIVPHQVNGIRIAEVISDESIITNVEEALQLLVDLYYQEFDKVILYEKNITQDFFDLKTKMAGEILQKFSNYRMQLTIVGDFEKYPGKSLKAFIYECNKGQSVNFVANLAAAF
ncbi:DUF4180 domain-containing protein [Flavobacterium cerinum]|uniref:DUF4180 domain-containing protein n=1 Tax=Flavobacterium cerinum TaxID=2502784 RepID=A0ABY5IPC6_9FLAO|nr:DUF4180 domain-containing protein [Flavobacterium cerinum]UUC44682.1 DUF4180 domain-containing protein [Flavobacterium cerinum]